MIIDGVLTSTPEAAPLLNSPFIRSFLSFIERRLNVTIVRDARSVPFERPDLADVLQIAQILKDRGVIQMLRVSSALPDEPPFRRWHAVCNTEALDLAVGASAENDRAAILAVCGEALERYLWKESRDHFVSPIRATVPQIRKRGSYIDPDRFVGLSAEDRHTRTHTDLNSDSSYLWVQATSHVSGSTVYVPAQTVSGHGDIRFYAGSEEPLIRHAISTGVATWPTREGAILRGALEVIERDAYMITWLNQISPEGIALDTYRNTHTPLSRLLARCERYGFQVHILRLVTDAPTYAACCVLEDMSGTAPRFAFGLKAHASLEHAIEGSLIEALRARPAFRTLTARGESWDRTMPVSDIGKMDRLYYWAQAEHADALEFLIRGPRTVAAPEPWDSDTEDAHLVRITSWCRERGYECASVPLGSSPLNPLPWHVEAVVIPELQPTYLSEKTRQISGDRIRTVPESLGFPVRSKPFIDAPHPFA